MHSQTGFDAVLSFDLSGAGGIAWRIGRDLGIAASGWATGGDVRQRARTPSYKSVSRTLQRLDLVFYQSYELRQRAAELLKIPHSQLSLDRHIVLPRGIAYPPELPKAEIRERLRFELGLTDGQIVVLTVGRISREKGVFELLKAVSLAAKRDSRIIGVIVGSSPSDESTAVMRQVENDPELQERVKLLPACPPHRVWEYLCAADIFAFPSHNEGMPNSLLEAMAMRVPSVAFAIPPVLEIENGAGSLCAVPPLNVDLFADALLRLAASPGERARIAEKGKSIIMERFLTRNNMAIALDRIAQIIRKKHTFKTPARS